MRQPDRLLKWLELDDTRSRSIRVKRLRFLAKEFGEGEHRIFYGEVAALAFEEARQAYLHGLFLACVFTCQVCVEQMLCGLLRASGRNDLEGASFQQILCEARDQRFLSATEFGKLERLRAWRNAYVHSRRPGSKPTLSRRAVVSNTLPEKIAARDARTAIRALLRLCQRAPFAY